MKFFEVRLDNFVVWNMATVRLRVYKIYNWWCFVNCIQKVQVHLILLPFVIEFWFNFEDLQLDHLSQYFSCENNEKKSFVIVTDCNTLYLLQIKLQMTKLWPMMTNGTEKVQFVCFSSCVFKHGAKTQQTSDLQPTLIILKKNKLRKQNKFQGKINWLNLKILLYLIFLMKPFRENIHILKDCLSCYLLLLKSEESRLIYVYVVL